MDNLIKSFSTSLVAPIASHVIQVNLVYPKELDHYLGSFNVWLKKGGSFGNAEELMKFCPTERCIETMDYGFYLTEAEQERIGDKIHKIKEWPEDIIEKYKNIYSKPVTCPRCGKQSNRKDWVASYIFNAPSDLIAERMSDLFYALETDADFYMVRIKSDAAKKAKAELSSPFKSMLRYEKLLEKSRDRDQVFYPMHKILKDIAAGSSVKSRAKYYVEA